MKLRKLIMDTARLVADEAERNPTFGGHLLELLSAPKEAVKPPKPARKQSPSAEVSAPSRPKNRRAPAAFNPIELAEQNEETLRLRLAELSLEQLRDIVADYGMDPGKLVAKWKDRDRVIDRIVELSIARLHKGDAFRTPND